MPKLASEKLPKYRKHRGSGQAIVTLSGKDHYLGPHGSKSSKREYDRLTAEWLANGRRLSSSVADELTIVEMLAAFRRFAVTHYQKDGKPTPELGNFDDAFKPLNMLYGRELVRDFGPLKLKALQRMMINGYTDANGTVRRGLSRGVINSRIGRIKHAFAWAVSEELARPSIAHSLATVRGLQRGRTDARETAPIKPVCHSDVGAIRDIILAGGRTLAEVRDAVGHSNVSITSAYLHVVMDEQELGSLFEFRGR